MPNATIRYQHAVDERDNAIADAVDDTIQSNGDRAHDAHGTDEDDEGGDGNSPEMWWR